MDILTSIFIRQKGLTGIPLIPSNRHQRKRPQSEALKIDQMKPRCLSCVVVTAAKYVTVFGACSTHQQEKEKKCSSREKCGQLKIKESNLSLFLSHWKSLQICVVQQGTEGGEESCKGKIEILWEKKGRWKK